MKFWTGALERYAQTIARESGRLLAILATNEGARMKLDWLLDTVFVAMVDELADRGVPRRVAADMFGFSHRTLQRRYAAATEGLDIRGRSVWTNIVEILRDGPLVREDVVGRVKHVPQVVVASVLNDMLENGWLEERGERLHLVAEIGKNYSDDELHRHTDIRRRAEPDVTPEEVAAAIGVDVERIESVWEKSPATMLKAKGDNIWMAMERSLYDTMRLLKETADQPHGSPNSATTWRVRLDDKPAEFQEEMIDFINQIAESIEARVVPVRTRYETDESTRFWRFTAFQSHDPPPD